jgi:sterol desaturase/sphingolipid hydroxylase (fatty acid hydroxylase superfamily)
METNQIIRLVFFLFVILAMGLWEYRHPKKDIAQTRTSRLRTNFSLIALDWLLARFTLGAVPIALSILSAQRGWGLLNLVGAPDILKIVATIAFLDLTIYLQHVLFHVTPWLWRLHKVHHSDGALDFSTGLRFHPLEIMISLGIKAFAILAFGAHPTGVLVFEILLNASSLFNHSNIEIAPRVDRALRWIIVTPDVHRIHHSTKQIETNSNFGFMVPWWDRLFKTWRGQPTGKELRAVTIGLNEYNSRPHLGLPDLIVLPFQSTEQSYSFDKNEPPKV